jgi:hypothetical protein
MPSLARCLHLLKDVANTKGAFMNATEMAEARNFLIWMALWIAALVVLLPALAGS